MSVLPAAGEGLPGRFSFAPQSTTLKGAGRTKYSPEASQIRKAQLAPRLIRLSRKELPDDT